MKPIKIRLGAYSASIYQIRETPALFRISWYEGRQRKLKAFSTLHPRHEGDEESAIGAAKAILGRMVDGQVKLTEIPTDRLRYYLQCEAEAQAEGISLHQAVKDAILARRTTVDLIPAKPADLIKALLATKEQDDLSDAYLRPLRSVLGAFARHFDRSIHEIRSDEIDAWIRSTGQGVRSRQNMLRSIRLLFNFAKTSGRALLRDRDTEADLVSMPSTKITHAVEIFKPEEMEKLLKAASEKLLPVLVLGAFCGVRTNGEITRIKWDNVREDGVIVEDQKVRGAGRRLGPMPPNAWAWLSRCRRQGGKVWPSGQISKHIEECSKKSKVTWKRNGLRHSFVSYRVAQLQDVPRVALESGNSPSMIFKHYRELVTQKQAEAWFEIGPI